MPRVARNPIGGFCYHVVTRANRRERVFHDDRDYAAFTALLKRSTLRNPMRILAFCLMPNHVHLVVWPRNDGDLGRWMHWLLTSHVRRHHLRYKTDGRIWQGRYKSFPIQEDFHLLVVMRYVERNPLRANLVERSEDWRWSSLARRPARMKAMLTDPPVRRCSNWLEFVNLPQTRAELADLRNSGRREAPYGDSSWVLETARRLNRMSTIRSPGRPRGKGDPGSGLGRPVPFSR